MIAERQKLILDAIVKEYIHSVLPISSKLLEKKYDFDICPATIRNDMQKLTELGYLYQPHTSAGRVPTDKAYRFFVNRLFENDIEEFDNVLEIKNVIEKQSEDVLRFASHLLRFLAINSSSLAMAHLSDRDFIWKEGWEEVLKEPEFEKKDFVHSFAGFLKTFENSIDDFNLDSEISIFIGNENPIPDADDFSVITSKCLFPDKNEAILTLLGPKRMDYNRNISLMNSLTKLLEDIN
ncbi:MAG: hypothetical protein KJI70_03350 [Patescibacteria group bacterium]|nr:hypothetical protein [Patescibacteria group bacterium]